MTDTCKECGRPLAPAPFAPGQTITDAELARLARAMPDEDRSVSLVVVGAFGVFVGMMAALAIAWAVS